MLSILAKKLTYRNLLFIFAAVLFFSCQKQLSFENDGAGTTVPDLSTKINSSVSGFVTDENGAAVMGASVQFGASSTTTDKYGFFEAKNVQVVKEAAVVTVNKPGYFKGIKTYLAREGKTAFFRIKLIPKTIAGNINATAGGIVTLSNGLSVKLPAAAVVNATTNAVYSGTVNVAAYWISPTASDLADIMPGDLRGIDTDSAIKLLQTFGMAAVELTGASGELLQIASGKKATLTLTIPASLSASAPATIPLWYFDEANGLWKEEGSATKTGNTYVGEVSHFSFWNCDLPGPMIQFDCTLKDPTGNPIPYVAIKMTLLGTANVRYGYTDSAGYASGLIPANSNMLMEVFGNFNCGQAVYSQTFTTTSSNLSLGTVTIPAGGYLATITGTVTNCANTPVTSGHVIVQENNTFNRYSLNNLGAFSFNILSCSLPQTILLIGEDVANSQQSASVTYNITNAGTHAIGNLQACGTSTQQFINYTINSTPYSFTSPADTFFYNNNNQSSIQVDGYTIPFNSIEYIDFDIDNAAIAVGSNQNLLNFNPHQIADTFRITTPVLVNITEYGAIGQFAAGTFSGVFTGASPANIQYNVTCNFRIRRLN